VPANPPTAPAAASWQHSGSRGLEVVGSACREGVGREHHVSLPLLSKRFPPLIQKKEKHGLIFKKERRAVARA